MFMQININENNKTNKIEILPSFDTVYVLEYGNYRKGLKNYRDIKQIFSESSVHKGLEYLESVKLEGYVMYDSGDEAICKYTGNKYDTIICDVIKFDQIGFKIYDNYYRNRGFSRHVVYPENEKGPIKFLIINLNRNNINPENNFKKIHTGNWEYFSSLTL